MCVSLTRWGRIPLWLLTVVGQASHPLLKRSLDEKKVGDPGEVLALFSLVLGPGTSHLTSLGLSSLLDKESKFGINDLQDSVVPENYLSF